MTGRPAFSRCRAPVASSVGRGRRFETCPAARAVRENGRRAFFRRLTDYFAAAGAQASLRGFAALTGYSAGYAGRLVLQKTGESFSALLAADRLRRAAALLESGDLSVEDVALTVGYANPSGLYKQFCAAYGMPPAAYRKLFR